MGARLAACDVFCRVVDNFGDAGVALRLARQLAAEHGLAVTLYVDDLSSLARIAPGVDEARAVQRRDGLVVRRFEDAAGADPARLVVEAFGCGLPERYLDAMEARTPPPVWIHLEYLSAEPWVEGVHGLPSPPPRRRLRRWFYFPGFTPRTGGLLRERGLAEMREGHSRDVAAHAAVWRALGVRALPVDALTVSLFCYPNRATAPLFARWAAEGEPVACVVPEGVATDAVRAVAGGYTPRAGTSVRAGALEVVVAPFVEQRAFDARLWSTALNFVRGEDSFVRAQWAARPLVWHAYPQPDDAHLAKIAAFLRIYAAGLPSTAAVVLETFWNAWNAQDGAAAAAAWGPLRSELPRLARHAGGWARDLGQAVDLATGLVAFARERL